MEINKQASLFSVVTGGLMKPVNLLKEAFALSDFTEYDDTIMPLNEVYSALHMYYVNQQEVWLTFEFQTSKGSVNEIARQVKVTAPIVDPSYVEVLDLESGQAFSLSLEQIISVAATTE